MHAAFAGGAGLVFLAMKVVISRRPAAAVPAPA